MTNGLVGKQLSKYQIQAEIGKGGMGMVYLGYDPLLDRKVAIKVLAPHLVWEEGFVERFLREARAAARLKHPNIVTIHDVGREEEWFYFVMEYLEGQTLADHIRQQGPLPPQTVLAILRPLADALDFAHQHDLVHRDIKPANITVGPAGHVTLTDFGIARAAQETRLTTTGTIMGTPEYMSPEQAWGEEVDYHTDLYSLAVVTYEMLSGQVPFSGTTPHAVLYKQIHEPPPPIRQTRPELPEGVEMVLAQALAKEPGRRYTTVAGFVDELARALEGKMDAPSAEAPTQVSAVGEAPPAPEPPTRATPTPVPAKAPAARPTRPYRRVPALLWVLGGLAAVALVVGLALLGLGGGDGSTPTPRPTLQPTPQPTKTRQPAATPAPTLAPPSARPECTDPAGCVVVEGEAPITIAYMLSLSAEGQLGVVARRGIEMAIRDRRQVFGRGIELIGHDSECSPPGGERAAATLAGEPNIVAVIGTSCSNAAQAAIPIMCEANIPVVSPSNTAPDLTAPDRPPNYDCYLRTAHNALGEAGAAARFARDLGIQRAATIFDSGPIAEMQQHFFSAQFSELGGEITTQEHIETYEAPAIESALTRIAATETKLIFYPLFVEGGAHVTNRAREHPQLRDPVLIGASGMFSPEFLATAGETAVGVLLSSPDVAAFAPGYQDFLGRYREEYGEPPHAPFLAQAYDAAMMIFAAIERVAVETDDGALYIGRRALRDALFDTGDFPGISGRLTCNRFGDCADPAFAVYEIWNPDPDSWNPGEGPDSNPRRIWP